MFAPTEFAPNFRVYILTTFAPKYAYYLKYFSFFKCEKNYLECFSFFKREKSVTTLVIGGGELEKGMERTRWVRTRLGAKPASFCLKKFRFILQILLLLYSDLGQFLIFPFTNSFVLSERSKHQFSVTYEKNNFRCN